MNLTMDQGFAESNLRALACARTVRVRWGMPRPGSGTYRQRMTWLTPPTPLRAVASVGLAIAVVACGRSLGNEPTRSNDPASSSALTPVAIVGVRVVTMTSSAVLDDQTIVVRDGVVAS